MHTFAREVHTITPEMGTRLLGITIAHAINRVMINIFLTLHNIHYAQLYTGMNG